MIIPLYTEATMMKISLNSENMLQMLIKSNKIKICNNINFCH